MVPSYDLHIQGGTIVDGTRVPRYKGDLWVKDGRIVKVGGRADGVSDRIVDATGLIVAPGFIDLHTHYDAQVRWDPWCTTSSWHGVTSVVLGNCGFGFAPCRPDFVERSMLTMVRTEAIPMASMIEGMLPKWDWETIPEYLDSLERAPLGCELHSVHAYRVADDLRNGSRSSENTRRDGPRAQRDATVAA